MESLAIPFWIKVDEPEPERVSNEPLPTSKRLPWADAYSDVAYLYTSFRWGYPESIVACDICDRWNHSRCSGIEDAEAVPPLFVCSHKGHLFCKVLSDVYHQRVMIKLKKNDAYHQICAAWRGMTLHSINGCLISLHALQEKENQRLFFISVVDELQLLQKGSLKL
ncbi:hypothetical protein BC332_16729 [Capsicum chinense]|nr:hypothetical protein BC332_16729 [Capsicum chinense]